MFIPLNKLPITDWITARYSYATTYNWIGASRVALSLGNTIENAQENNINTQFNFANLYAKSKLLRSIDNVSMQRNNTKAAPSKNVLGFVVPSKEDALKNLTGKLRVAALQKWRQQ